MLSNIQASQLYQAQQVYFNSGDTYSYTFRKNQLKRFKNGIKKFESKIIQALQEDLHKHPMESYVSEVGFMYEEIDYMLENLKQWMEPEAVTSPFVTYPSSSKVYKEPLGVTLIIGPWNYPFMLLLCPLLGAIAGGNCAIVKPSEMAPHTAAVISALISDTFDPAYIAVVEGDGSTVIPTLMAFRFDHVFFTGSMPVGKKIMELAVPHLTPVTLELGGKSPCVVDENVNITVAAKRIVWGKFWNAGQTCVAPDYLLVHQRVKEELVAAMKAAIVDFYGENPAASDDYSHLINARRFDTVAAYLQEGRIIHGGQTDRDKLYIAPTLLDEVEWSDPVMQEEIFGPVLPILTYTDLSQAIGAIKQLPAPLALYVFTKSRKTEQRVIEQVRFGGGCVNNALLHLINPELPFGGRGHSGTGQYHGKYSFDTFTHRKGIMKTANWLDVPLKYAPFGKKLKVIRKIM
ncbi:aldehyde dehydrogenase [Chitinophaga nivalis]|uniref:Aldehyde dehydrogenase n=1 Tax=Chitinophaga nivalis TaxID=2991709 RepID=A0ABT3IV79_9BACT|nr:aldehyde dehydrogenase [Chitinophaga nivalis]MCW3462725.1 aldehyde dehydrogenase [Chitinophaga nivalis]MCW3487584.1 aldehyde dehydrogenase [Chitinophaga nivalis]